MRAFLLLLLLLPTTSSRLDASEAKPTVRRKAVKAVSDWNTYRTSIAANPGHEMVDLEKFIPGIALELKYASTDNFMREMLYPVAKAFLRRDAAVKLRAAQESLKSKGLGFKIYDAYRPYSVTAKMWRSRIAPPAFLAPPSIGSAHNRGVAVDLTLMDLKTGHDLEMPTRFDTFTRKASYAYTDLPEEVLKNRTQLNNVMRSHGFVRYNLEWWHFSLRGEEAYDALDLSLTELMNAP